MAWRPLNYFLGSLVYNKKGFIWEEKIENQLLIVSANSRGTMNDKGDLYGGHSATIDPWSEYVVAPDDQVGINIVK